MANVLNESILHKDGMDLLVEETILENELVAIKTNINNVAEKIINEAPEDQNTPEFIDLRNSSVMNGIINADFLPDELAAFGSDIFTKKVSYEHALKQLYKINTILGQNYKISDIYNNAVYEREADGKINVSYDSVNINIINEFKNKLERSLDCIHDCLYNDLYDKSILKEYLPKVMIIQALDK